ncbi:PAS domain S-box protein [Paenibacillus sp. GCM10027629]|uniref:PAS domain S-box protein n=1 Tax=Paenibacillus sp. GCM10027629 TaxID=3273414 RepID=UPI00362DC256
MIYRIVNGAGQYITFEEFTTPVYKDGEVVAFQGILRNITDKLKLQEELEYRITHDSLTGVYNREFIERLIEKYDKN